jgi:hypothetical protein
VLVSAVLIVRRNISGTGKKENRNTIRYDEREALLEKKHSSEFHERYKAMAISRSHFNKPEFRNEFWGRYYNVPAYCINIESKNLCY